MRLTELDLDSNPFGLSDATLAAVREAGVTSSLWPAEVVDGRVVLFLSAYGIRVYDGAANPVIEWSDMYALEVSPAQGLRFRTGPNKQERSFALLADTHWAEIYAATKELGADVRTETPDFEQQSERAGSGRSADRATAARRSLLGLFWFGLFGVLLGTFMALTAYPGTKISDLTGERIDTGDRTLTIVGSVISTVGSGMVLVALIGWAVMLGVQAASD